MWKTTENCFGEICTAVKGAIEQAGYKCKISDRIDPICRNILFGVNACIRASITDPIPSDSIIVNMEQLYDGSPWVNETYLQYLRMYTLWDYNMSNIHWLSQRINNIPKKFTLGYTDLLDKCRGKNQDIDVLFYGGLNGRRLDIMNKLKERGINNIVFRSNDLWGKEKNDLISRAKIVLNLHYYESALLEYPRIVHLLNNGKFVISETSKDISEYEFLDGGMVFCDYNNIVDIVIHYISAPEEMNRISERGYQLLKCIPTQIPIKPKIHICLNIVLVSWMNSSGNVYSKDVLLDVANLYKEYFSMRGYKVSIIYLGTEQTLHCPNGECINIVFGAHLLKSDEHIPKNSIIVDLEQLNDESPQFGKYYIHVLKNHEVWTYSSHNVEWLRRKNITNVKHVPFGYMPSLEHGIDTDIDTNIDTDIDVLFYGNLSARRIHIQNMLIKVLPSIKITFKDNIWGDERDNLISRSKIILNIGNYHDIHLFEAVRVIPLLARQKFVISEECTDGYNYEYLNDGLVFCSYTDIISKVVYYLNHPLLRHTIALKGYNNVKRNPLTLPPLCNTSLIKNSDLPKTHLGHTMTKLEQTFKYYCGQNCDINLHLPVLSRMASTCSSINSLSYSYSSNVIWAFLYGLSKTQTTNPKSLMCVAPVHYKDTEHLQQISQLLNVTLTFKRCNKIQTQLSDVDLTFIDTWHVYAHLKRELETYAPKTQKYIILHDTEIDKTYGESIRMHHDISSKSIEWNYPESEIKMGIDTAIKQFITSNTHWKIYHHYPINNGLTILVRTSSFNCTQ